MARTIAKDHDEKRGAMLDTAARFFAENGYDRSSMTELALRCGISKALIYHYYDSKESMLFDILNTHIGSLLQGITATSLDRDDPKENLQLLVSTLLESYRGADHLHRLQLEAMSALTEEQQKSLAAMQKEIVQAFSKIIAKIRPELFEGKAKKNLIPVTMSLFGMMNWFYQWHRPQKGMSRSDYAALSTDIILGGIENLAAKEKLKKAA